MKDKSRNSGPRERGVIVVFVALLMIVLLGMTALAIDIGYLYVVRGELQNAADAGALAGAQVLYLNNGQQVNAGADAVATNYVTNNFSEQAPVTVQSVQRGHWSFASRTFTPNDSLAPVDLWNATTAELDANTNFINAVRVQTTRRTVNGQVAEPFFARILGVGGSPVAATAVAYIGFAGTLTPHEADQPIAICKQSLIDDVNRYNCSVGRMLNSGTGGGTTSYSGTGGWTSFEQPTPPSTNCGAASTSTMNGLICTTGNGGTIVLGQPMSTTGGVQNPTFELLKTCWEHTGTADLDGDGDLDPVQPWALTLPVIDCPQNNVTSCNLVVGAVTVNVVWIIRDNPVGSDPTNMTPRAGDVPRQMAGWSCPSTTSDRDCWLSFVSAFHLEGPNHQPAIASAKTIYFLPDCTPHIPAGLTGGENFGILARIPVLVGPPCATGCCLASCQ
jgi:Flp pilus assembly protein TadG